MENEIFSFDFDFDLPLLTRLWHEKYEEKAETYDDPRLDHYMNRPEFKAQYGDWSKDVWKVSRMELEEYPQKLIELFDVNAKPRFYTLRPNAVLPFHVDNDTTCAINFILSDEPAPVTFQESGNTHYYKTAVLNTSLWHGVWNGPKERLLFKLSIFDEPFENVIKKVKKITK
jgi:hypothetical protein